MGARLLWQILPSSFLQADRFGYPSEAKVYLVDQYHREPGIDSSLRWSLLFDVKTKSEDTSSQRNFPNHERRAELATGCDSSIPGDYNYFPRLCSIT